MKEYSGQKNGTNLSLVTKKNTKTKTGNTFFYKILLNGNLTLDE